MDTVSFGAAITCFDCIFMLIMLSYSPTLAIEGGNGSNNIRQ